VRIVFKRENEDSPDLTFVDIEDDAGRSVDVGEWRDEGDGFQVLVVPDAPATTRGRSSWLATDAEKSLADQTLRPNSPVSVEFAGAYVFEAPPVFGDHKCTVNGVTTLWSTNSLMRGLLYLAAGDEVAWNAAHLGAHRVANLRIVNRH
jgi:hypothetical protein